MRSGRPSSSKKDERSLDLADEASERFREVKQKLRDELLEVVDFEAMAKTQGEQLVKRLRVTLAKLIQKRQYPLNRMERERVIDEIVDNLQRLSRTLTQRAVLA